MRSNSSGSAPVSGEALIFLLGCAVTGRRRSISIQLNSNIAPECNAKKLQRAPLHRSGPQPAVAHPCTEQNTREDGDHVPHEQVHRIEHGAVQIHDQAGQ